MKLHVLQTIRNFLFGTLAFLTMVIGGVYMYSYYIEEPYLSYHPLPFPMIDHTVYPGGVAAAIAKRCNKKDIRMSYASTRQLKRENSTQPAVILEAVEITADPGCTTVSTRANVVPEDTQPGFYRFSGVANIRGLMVEHKVGWNTDVFEVITKPAAAAVGNLESIK